LSNRDSWNPLYTHDLGSHPPYHPFNLVPVSTIARGNSSRRCQQISLMSTDFPLPRRPNSAIVWSSRSQSSALITPTVY
jgi:hypothetical protein